MLIPAADRLAPPDPDEFHVHDLVGLEVVLQEDGVVVGVVTDLFDGTGERAR